jgi:hypothetical protein
MDTSNNSWIPAFAGMTKERSMARSAEYSTLMSFPLRPLKGLRTRESRFGVFRGAQMSAKPNKPVFRKDLLWVVCALFALLLFSSTASAQQPANDSSHSRPAPNAEELARQSLHYRIVDLINSMTARVNAEGAEFNKRLAQMNAAAPLQTSHLDSAGVATNVPLVLEFLQYLKECRKSSDSLDRAFNDSLFALNADLPAEDADAGLKEIGDSFNKDRAAFSNFLASLDKLYAKVLDALLFLQNAHYTIEGDRVALNSNREVTEYSKLMKKVDAANAELTKANEAVRKANAEANKKVKLQRSDNNQ